MKCFKGFDKDLKCGNFSALTGGYKSALTGGNFSALTGGDFSALTGGGFSVVYGGEGAKVRAGKGSILVLQYWVDNETKESIGKGLISLSEKDYEKVEEIFDGKFYL